METINLAELNKLSASYRRYKRISAYIADGRYLEIAAHSNYSHMSLEVPSALRASIAQFVDGEIAATGKKLRALGIEPEAPKKKKTSKLSAK